MNNDQIIPPDDEPNRTLLKNVRPSGWKNPMPASCYNLVVLGAGTAGLVSAAGAAGLGAKVALVERGLMGGDCLNIGCVPSKGIIRSGRAVQDVRAAEALGVSVRKISIDFAKAMERMRRVRAGISHHDSAMRFSKELGVDVFLGQGKFIGRETIEVEGKTLRFKKAAICTGARPAVPPIPGLSEAGYLTNENVFQLTELSRRIAIIGGGPIGCELSQAFARLGCDVTVIEKAHRILIREDGDAAELVQRSLVRDKVKLLLNAEIVNVWKHGAEKVLTITRDKHQEELIVDEVFVGIGRAPNVEGLGLEAGGVLYDTRSGIAVNDRLQTSNPRVYAAGDVCSPYQFTHVADALARILIENALFKGKKRMSSLVVPWCTYTDPEVAHVGMHENEAIGSDIEITTLTVQLAEVDRALLDNETEGFARVHLKKGADRILGATIVARHAGEMINELTLAMTAGLGLAAIGRTVHPYPTQAEAIKKLADAYNRTRLTPIVKKVLGAWLRWQRS